MLFSHLNHQAPDPLLSLIATAKLDLRPDKIDLGVGVYRDETGQTPVMNAVKLAEAELLQSQLTKSYLGAEGDTEFVSRLFRVVFGKSEPVEISGLQTPGGTGALRLGGELVRRARPDASVWIGTPSWPNHAAIFESVGLVVRNYPLFDHVQQTICFGELLHAVATARPSDVFVLQAASHNPTGADFSNAQWDLLIDAMAQARVVPFLDSAYQGLGHGLNEDAYGLRECFARLPEAMLAYSCDKNFGLYRERVGALWVKASSDEAKGRLHSNILALARANWSMPPDHGAAIVRIILENDALSESWRNELTAMRNRIAETRRAMVAADPDFEMIQKQSGMFSTLPLHNGAVRKLRDEHAIYVATDGRINLAGLRLDQVERATRAFASVMKKGGV